MSFYQPFGVLDHVSSLSVFSVSEAAVRTLSSQMSADVPWRQCYFLYMFDAFVAVALLPSHCTWVKIQKL